MPKKNEVREYEAGFLVCRALLGHAWHETSRHREDGKFVYGASCERCGTTKLATYSKFGYLTSTQYNYPDGYKLGGDITRADLRVELFRRETK